MPVPCGVGEVVHARVLDGRAQHSRARRLPRAANAHALPDLEPGLIAHHVGLVVLRERNVVDHELPPEPESRPGNPGRVGREEHVVLGERDPGRVPGNDARRGRLGALLPEGVGNERDQVERRLARAVESRQLRDSDREPRRGGPLQAMPGQIGLGSRVENRGEPLESPRVEEAYFRPGEVERGRRVGEGERTLASGAPTQPRVSAQDAHPSRAEFKVRLLHPGVDVDSLDERVSGPEVGCSAAPLRGGSGVAVHEKDRAGVGRRREPRPGPVVAIHVRAVARIVFIAKRDVGRHADPLAPLDTLDQGPGGPPPVLVQLAPGAVVRRIRLSVRIRGDKGV